MNDSAPEVLPGILQAGAHEAPSRPGRRGFHIHGDAAAIFAALACARADFGPVERTRVVHVKSDRGDYSFAYAPLDTVLLAVAPALSANGLVLLQPFVREGDDWVLRTLLAHKSGGYLETSMLVAQPVRRWFDKQSGGWKESPGGWQELGSAITYARRYMVGALLGIAPEEDDDGTATESLSRDVAPKVKPNARPTPPPSPKAAEPDPKPVKKEPAKELAGPVVQHPVASGANGKAESPPPPAPSAAATTVKEEPAAEASESPISSDLSAELHDLFGSREGWKDENGVPQRFFGKHADALAKTVIGVGIRDVKTTRQAMAVRAALLALPELPKV